MLLHVFILLLAVHYVYLALGIERRRGGYVLISIMILLILMWSAVFVIQLPVSVVDTVSNSTTNSSTNTTITKVVSDAHVFVRGIRDPVTAFFLFAQELIDLMVYGTLTKWGVRNRKGWF